MRPDLLPQPSQPLTSDAPMPNRRLRWPRLRSIAALALRDMSAQYGRSPGGYAWAILEPLGAILILAVGFSMIIRSPALGNSFILFYATGFLPFDMFNKTSSEIGRALVSSKNLLAYPTVKWIDAIIAKLVLNLLTSSLVACVLLAGILIIEDINVVVSYGPILLSFVLAAGLGTGIGLLNSILNGLVPVWASFWRILTRPLLLISGIIILHQDLPKAAQDILSYNPLVHITALSRIGFFPTYNPQFISVVYVMIWIVLLLALGLLLARRFHREILNK